MKIPAPQPPTRAQKKILTKRMRADRAALALSKQQRRERAVKHAVNPLDHKKQFQYHKTTFEESLVDHLLKQLHASVRVDPKVKGAPVYLDVVDSVPTEMGVFAATDFTSITINVHKDKVPGVHDVDGIKHFINSVRGLFQHEAGHIVHSWPLWDVWGAASSSVRDRAAHEGIHNWETLHGVWNPIEDQRMESARVRDYPAVQEYFEWMMAWFLLDERDEDWWSWDAWCLLAGRLYLDADIRNVAYAKFSADADEWLRLVNVYKRAETADEILNAIIDCYLFARANGKASGVDALDAHETGGIGAITAPDGASKGKASATQPGDGSEGTEGGRLDADGKPDEDTLTHGLEEGSPHFTKRELQDKIDSLKNGLDLTTTDKSTVNSAAEGASHVGLTEYTGELKAMTGEEEGTAVSLSHDIVRALETFVTRATPTWQLRVDDGFLDPLPYRTREPGELDYHIGMSGEQGKMLDLHVSVLADVSGSMSRHMRQLSTILFGMKMAVDELLVPNNFTIWSSGRQHYRIYSDGPSPVVYPSMGGTDPRVALSDAVLQNVDERPHHLVVIFTDGAWGSTVTDIGPWRTSEEQKFVIVKFGQGPHAITGAEDIIDLPALSKLPEVLQDSLDSMLSIVT